MKAKRLVSCLCTALLTLSLVPPAALAEMASGSDVVAETGVTTSAAIEELLARGNYVEGEAIAIVRSGSGIDLDAETDDLTTASADSVELAAKDAVSTEAVADDTIALRAQSTSADDYTIKLVIDHSRTTAEILNELYGDPDVVSAEPNYLIENPLAFEAEEPVAEDEQQLDAPETQDEPSDPEAQGEMGEADCANGAAAEDPAEEQDATPLPDDTTVEAEDPLVPAATEAQPLTAQDAEPNPGDLTSQQWGLDESMSIFTTPISPTAGYSLNIPGWLEGRNNPSAPANASGTVCIMDTGLDITHPDLQNVLYDFEANLSAERYAELKAKYGMGRFGLNASGSGKTDDINAYNSHGVHVAGIVAAQWNGLGTSGVANGIKIFGLRIFGDDGRTQDAAHVLKGFQFLVDVAQEVNLKAVNCSWGDAVPQFSYEVMVNELGKKGVNVVFASGNRFANLDETIDNGGMSTSPYSITVNAASPNGKMTDFSCYGQASTDVFAPGTQILSTISQQIDRFFGDGENARLAARDIFKRFFPEATNPTNVLTYERFNTNPGVRFFAENPATNPEAKELSASKDTAIGFDDSACAAVSLASLNKDNASPGQFTGVNGYLYLAIPVSSVANAKWIALKHAMSDGFKADGQINAITCTDENGKPIEVSANASTLLKTGWSSAATYTIYQCQWSPVSLNVDGFIEASNQAHEIIAKGGSIGEATQAGNPEYTDPGKATSIYGWENNGSTYIIARYAIGWGAPTSPQPNPDSTLLLDNVAVGNAGSFVEAYEDMPGTSMAAPAVSGCLAVIAKDEPASGTLSDAELELEARERKAKLLAAVDYDDDLAKLCRTGGRVNLHGQSAFTKKAPIITRATSEGEELTIEGFFFGDTGTLTIDGKEIATTSWDDALIGANVSSLGLDNGSHVAKVTNADGAAMQMPFSYLNDSAAKIPLYERTHSVPVNDKTFVADKSDAFYGSMAYCDGNLYEISTGKGDRSTIAMWCYNVASDSWKRHDLPKGYESILYDGWTTQVNNNSLIAYKGKIYLKGVDGLNNNWATLWCYDPSSEKWSDVKLQSGKQWPTGELAVLGDKLFICGVSDFYFNPDEEDDEPEASPAGMDDSPEDSGDEGSIFTKLYFGLVDLDKGTITKVEGPLNGFAGSDGIDTGMGFTTSSNNHIYMYAANAERNTEGWLIRFTYDEANNKMSYEDLSSSVKDVIGDFLMPEYERASKNDNVWHHYTMCGLPDGVAIIGSPTIGEDTHIIKDGSTELITYPRTSSYHQTFYPLATYGDGYLYALGINATEPDVMYFRSTQYPQQTTPEPEPTPTPAPTPDPAPTPTPAPSGSQSPSSGAKKNSGTTSATKASGKASKLPKTGDETSRAIPATLAILGLGTITLAIRARRRESR
ncbi:MAG: S8 family serine peptidase [Atopobiaceae bacterium]|nr:S8 family serine peptidase [Atopobiaceae bacterium]